MKQESFARKLRLLRAERGLTLVQAAELTGLTRGTISELELGRREAYMPTLHKIAEGYGVNVRELLLEDPVPMEEVEAPESERQAELVTGPKAEAREIGRPHEWAKEFGARLHGMSDEEWIDHVRALESVDEIAEEFHALTEESKMLHAAYATDKWQRQEDRERRIELFRTLREMRAYRLADLAAAAKLRKADELFREVVQALDESPA
jgi:transcriptional regulator with XRE-family HTH domain